MKKFRLPRKTKKALQHKLWLYPADKTGSSKMAWPTKLQEDYHALKKGIVTNSLTRSRNRREALYAKLDNEVYVEDAVLRSYVDDIFELEFRNSSYAVLLEAKVSRLAKRQYFNFINAYQMYQQGDDSMGNICCLAIDHAKSILKAERRKRIQKRRGR
jgi:hypothetical protein